MGLKGGAESLGQAASGSLWGPGQRRSLSGGGWLWARARSRASSTWSSSEGMKSRGLSSPADESGQPTAAEEAGLKPSVRV